MRFQHAPEIWSGYPELVAGVVHATGIRKDAEFDLEPFTAVAAERLAGRTESELEEIQAWRRAFSRMGLKPTQYRCAAESLLRRFRKDGALPRIHPVIDLCNAVSLAYAIPVAVLDLDQIAGDLEVRPATGDESYLTFAGTTEHPEPGEVIFADDAGRAHARRWTNRQSGASAVRGTTTTVLIVAEALHPSAPVDLPRLLTTLTHTMATPPAILLTATSPSATLPAP